MGLLPSMAARTYISIYKTYRTYKYLHIFAGASNALFSRVCGFGRGQKVAMSGQKVAMSGQKVAMSGQKVAMSGV